jgi:hypothetical protein
LLSHRLIEPFNAGPINFSVGLWQVAQLALNNISPLVIVKLASTGLNSSLIFSEELSHAQKNIIRVCSITQF